MLTPSIKWKKRQQKPDRGSPNTTSTSTHTRQTLISNILTAKNLEKNTEKLESVNTLSTNPLQSIPTINRDQQQKQKATATTKPMKANSTHRENSLRMNTQEDRWGHLFAPKETGYVRFLAQNIGGIDLTPSGSIKLAAL